MWARGRAWPRCGRATCNACLAGGELMRLMQAGLVLARMAVCGPEGDALARLTDGPVGDVVPPLVRRCRGVPGER